MTDIVPTFLWVTFTSLAVISLIYEAHPKHFQEKENSRWPFPRQISRYLPVLTLGPPLRSGNAALFTLLSHGSGERC